jgi:hypothetical protein
LKKPAKASKALAARAKAKTPSAKATKVTKPKVAAPAKKAATPATAKPVAGRKPPTVREAVTPKKVGEDIAKETAKEVADNLGDGEQLCDAGKVTEAAHTTIKVNDAEVAIIEAIEINEVRRLWSTVEVTEHRGDCQNQGRGRRGRGFDEVGGNHKDDGIACEGCGGCKRAAGRDV